MALDKVTTGLIADNAIDSDQYVDGSIDSAHVGNLQVTAAKVASDVATVAGSQTLTNKTLTAPTLTTPALGTPASGVVTNLTGVLPVGVTGGSGLNAIDGTVTHHDMWSANSSTTGRVNPITAWARGTTERGWARINAAEPMTLASGVFTFPVTGIWKVFSHHWIRSATNGDASCRSYISVTLDNSTWNYIASGVGYSNTSVIDSADFEVDVSAVITVASTTNTKVRFAHNPGVSSMLLELVC